MKPSFQHLGFDQVEGSFLCYWVKSLRFGFHWHYHPELEISFVVQGQGNRMVGDHVDNFHAGDLVLMGPNLPHTWISNPDFHTDNKEMEVVVVQFPQELLVERSLEISELTGIHKLLARSGRGLSFPPETVEEVKDDLIRLSDLEGFSRYHLLLSILNRLSESPSIALASELYTPLLGKEAENRLGVVCRYLHEHVTEAIELSTLAELAHMNEAAFCRFFKRMTGRTAITYLNDLRISKACHLLMESQEPIASIAYDVGYHSLTHFNRSFLQRKQMTPSAFRKQFQGG